MPYSAEVYAGANLVLEERRKNAQRLANLKKADIYAKFPDIQKLDNELSRNMARLSVLILKGEKELGAAIDEMQAANAEIKAKRAAILAANGFDADYTEPKYTCPLCEDIGRKNGILCQCYKKACREQALKELAASSGAAACSFDNFSLEYYADNGAADGTNPRRKMNNYYEFCKKYAESFSNESPSIVMMGKTGLGKTHLSLSIAKAAAECGAGVIYVPAQKLVGNLEKEHFSNAGDSFMKKYTNCDLLIIDDLGAEFQSTFGTAAIGNLINERLYSNYPTVISTNLTSKELSDRYSERTASRILGEYRKLFFVGEDIRFLKNSERK